MVDTFALSRSAEAVSLVVDLFALSRSAAAVSLVVDFLHSLAQQQLFHWWAPCMRAWKHRKLHVRQ